MFGCIVNNIQLDDTGPNDRTFQRIGSRTFVLYISIQLSSSDVRELTYDSHVIFTLQGAIFMSVCCNETQSLRLGFVRTNVNELVAEEQVFIIYPETDILLKFKALCLRYGPYRGIDAQSSKPRSGCSRNSLHYQTCCPFHSTAAKCPCFLHVVAYSSNVDSRADR